MAKLKSSRKKSLSIVAATGMALFSLVVVFVATIAWFAMNNGVGNDGMTIKVAQINDAVETVAIHRCILNQSTDNNLVFDSQHEVDRLVVPDYSELNKSQPTLLLFEFSGDQSSLAANIQITATSTSASYETDITEDNYNSFPFSTAITFKTVYTTAANFPFANVTSDMLSDPITFVEIEDHDFTSFSQTVSIFDGPSLSNPPQDPITYVGVIIDYYDEALEILSAYNTGNEHRLRFDFDFTMSIA